MHEDLAVYAQHIKQADVAFAQGLALLFAKLIAYQQCFDVLLVLRLRVRFAIQDIEKFLQLVEAHHAPSFGIV